MSNTLKLVCAFLVCLLMTVSQTIALPSVTNEASAGADICNHPPIIHCPAFVWLKPSESSHPNRTGYPVVSPGGAGCGSPIVTYTDQVFVINACHKVYTRIWTAVDPNNPSLQDTCHQMIKQLDEEPPIFTTTQDDISIYTNNMDVNTINCTSYVQWTEPTVTDNHLRQSLSYVVYQNGQLTSLRKGSYFSDGQYTVIYTAYDYCGNFSQQSFSITVMCADCHISCPENATLSLNSNISPSTLGSATNYAGNANCGALINISYRDYEVENNCSSSQKITRIWFGEFENMPGETYNCSQIIELKDPESLMLHNCPSDVNVENNYTVAHWTEPVATSSSNENVLTLTTNYGPGQTFPVGITTVIYTVTDACGETENCSFKVSVLNDATYHDCPDDIILQCDDSGSVIADWNTPVYNGTCNECQGGASIPGFIFVGSFNGSKYYCSRSNYSYEESKIKAAQAGGHLVSIESEEENQFVADHIGSATAFIGLTDANKEGDFIWDDGSAFGYNNWYQFQPNDYNNQDYVEIMRSGLWNDIENDAIREFVMEIPCEYVRQISGPQVGTELSPGTYTVSYVISDGCNMEQHCAFDITVRGNLAVVCQNDMFLAVPITQDQTSVTWNSPNVLSCCSNCADAASCVTITQTEGPLPGSNFYKQSITRITYEITDACDQKVICSFLITLDIEDNHGRLDNDTDNNLSLMTETSSENIITNPVELFESIEIETPTVKTVLEAPYPNPASDILNIELKAPELIESLEIRDQNGQRLNKLTSGINTKTTINITALDNGLYFLIITKKDASQDIFRFIKM